MRSGLSPTRRLLNAAVGLSTALLAAGCSQQQGHAYWDAYEGCRTDLIRSGLAKQMTEDGMDARCKGMAEPYAGGPVEEPSQPAPSNPGLSAALVSLGAALVARSAPQPVTTTNCFNTAVGVTCNSY